MPSRASSSSPPGDTCEASCCAIPFVSLLLLIDPDCGGRKSSGPRSPTKYGVLPRTGPPAARLGPVPPRLAVMPPAMLLVPVVERPELTAGAETAAAAGAAAGAPMPIMASSPPPPIAVIAVTSASMIIICIIVWTNMSKRALPSFLKLVSPPVASAESSLVKPPTAIAVKLVTAAPRSRAFVATWAKPAAMPAVTPALSSPNWSVPSIKPRFMSKRACLFSNSRISFSYCNSRYSSALPQNSSIAGLPASCPFRPCKVFSSWEKSDWAC